MGWRPHAGVARMTGAVLLVYALAPGAAVDARVLDGVSEPSGKLSTTIRLAARPLTGDASDYDALMAIAADARFVLLGAETYGTNEFHVERARVTRRLVEELGFRAVAIEGDWRSVERVRRYVLWEGSDGRAEDALADLEAFPRWMWRNTAVREFVEWLRTHNGALPAHDRVGVYGLDLGGPYASIDAVVDSLERFDPAAADLARERYRCIDAYRPSTERLAEAAARGDLSAECLQGVRSLVDELRDRLDASGKHEGDAPDPELFSAYRNAASVADTVDYYRRAAGDPGPSWNIRARHMADTLESVSFFLREPATGLAGGVPARVVVWSHNDHVGDARFTALARGARVSAGQLMRQRQPGAVALVGFTTYRGTLLAAHAGGGGGSVRELLPAVAGSHGDLFHDTGLRAFVLPLDGDGSVEAKLARGRLQRSVTAVYRPESERASHYLRARISKQFDAIVHLDETTAVTPLDEGSSP
jgi:erythromycin esterase-like protein